MHSAPISKKKELKKKWKKRENAFQEKNETLSLNCLSNLLKKQSYNGFKPNYFKGFLQQINSYVIAI